MIIRDFISPLDSRKITSRHGFMYAVCARQLHYASETGKMGYTMQAIKAMQWGTDNHSIIKDWLSKNVPNHNFRFEQHYEREINSVGGIDLIGATYDVVSHKMAIEIKPKYSLKAYIQIRVQAFVNPTWDFYVFQYMDLFSKKPIRSILFPVQTGTEKDIAYVARIITALNHKPPRFPTANESNPVCRSCIFFDRCYSESESNWNTFGQIAKLYLSKLDHNSKSIQ